MAPVRIDASVQPPPPAIEHLSQALADATAGVGTSHSSVEWLPTSLWLLSLARFGNVALRDAIELERLLQDELSALPPLQLRLAVVTPLPEDGDDSVWVGCEGDIEALESLARSIPTWVRPFGFLLDRRSFRPRIRLGRVTAATTVSDLERLVAGVGGYEGPNWTARDIVLGRPRREQDDSVSGYDIDARIRFSSARTSGFSP